jgi:hypothetical protein
MVLSGIKLEEYREIKRHWIQRFCNEVDWEFNSSSLEDVFKKYDTITFKNGYKKNARLMVVEFKGIDIGEAKPEWSDNWQGDVFRIKLGKIIEYDIR